MNIKQRTAKRFWAISVFVLLMGGTPSVEAQNNNSKTIITTSFYPVYIMALNVVKNVSGVEVVNLTASTTGCLHDYNLTPQEMVKLSSSSLLIINGLGMESFLDKVISQYPKLDIVRISDGISPLKDSHGPNPHVWVSVSNAIVEVENLGKILEAFDPAHQQLYRQNTQMYVSKLESLRSEMQTALSSYKGKKIVTFHEAFAYFAQEFGLDIVSVIEHEPGSQTSARELAETIELIRQKGVKVVFSEPQYSSSAADAVARDTGAKVYVLDPAVTGPDSLDAYLFIMKNNLKALKKAFAQ